MEDRLELATEIAAAIATRLESNFRVMPIFRTALPQKIKNISEGTGNERNKNKDAGMRVPDTGGETGNDKLEGQK